MSAPAQRPALLSADEAIAAVRAAGEGLEATAAKTARRVRAARPDVVAALAALPDGSGDATAARAELKGLGIAATTITASIRWHRAQERREAREREREADDRPLLRCDSELNADVAAAVDALTRDPDLYQRSEQLVRVVTTDDGEHVIRPHTAATLRARLAHVARFEKLHERTGDWVPCLPPDPVCQAVLELREYPGVRVLSAITGAPSMRPDMSILSEPGHDPTTGLLYIPTIEFPPVPDAPTPEQAQAALQFLWVELSHGAPHRGMGYASDDWRERDPDGVLRFVNARNFPDAWGLIGMIFSILTRPVYVDGNIPAQIASAPTPGSGKGLQVDLACIVGLGTLPDKHTWPEADSADARRAEADKMLVGEARKGASVTVFDEIGTVFGSGGLQNALTGSGRFTARILGQSETPSFRWRPVILGTGPNVELADNMRRRTLRICLDPVATENPDERGNWRHEEIRAWARAHRAELVVAALTVLRAYVVAGMPDVGLPIWGGGFEAWSKLVPRAIKWAGGGDLMGCRPSVDPEARNEEKERIEGVIDAVEKLEPRNNDGAPTGAGITIADVISRLYTPERLKGQLSAQDMLDGFDGSREAIEAITGTAPGRKPRAQSVSEALKHWNKRPIGGRQLEHAGKAHNALRWTVRNFSRPAPVAVSLAPAASPGPVPETEEQRLIREAEAERLNCG